MELETRTGFDFDRSAKMIRRSRLLAKDWLQLQRQSRARERRVGLLWRITDPFQLRCAEMDLALEEDREKASFATLSDAIDSHNREACAMGDADLCVAVGHAAGEYRTIELR